MSERESEGGQKVVNSISFTLPLRMSKSTGSEKGKFLYKFFDDSGSRHFVSWILIRTVASFTLLQCLATPRARAENYFYDDYYELMLFQQKREPIKNTTIAISIKKLKWKHTKKYDFPSLLLLRGREWQRERERKIVYWGVAKNVIISIVGAILNNKRQWIEASHGECGLGSIFI